MIIRVRGARSSSPTRGAARCASPFLRRTVECCRRGGCRTQEHLRHVEGLLSGPPVKKFVESDIG